MIFSNKVSHQIVYPALYLDRVRLKEVDEHKHLGLILSKIYHGENISQKYVKRQTSVIASIKKINLHAILYRKLLIHPRI
jgi:hypothetical protein